MARLPPSGSSDPLECAIREIAQPESEVCAFLDFRDALREHLGLPWESWERVEDDPPDYRLFAGGQKIGVEVTTLHACKALFAANAQLENVCDFLEEQTRGVQQRGSLEIVYEPDSAHTVPRTSTFPAHFAPLFEYLREPPASPYGAQRIALSSGKVWVRWLEGQGPGLHVVGQRFYLCAGQGAWASDINEAVRTKVTKYSDPARLPLRRPCWLLVNLKPYLPGDPANRAFLQMGVRVEEPEKVSAIFERVFALTQYIPWTGGRPVCPVRQLLPEV